MKMKSTFLALALVVSMSLSSVSRAGIGAGMGNPFVFAAGIAALAYGSSTMFSLTDYNGNSVYSFFLGILLLDDSHGAVSAQFQALDDSQAQKLQLTSDEQTAFNTELSKINLISNTVASDVKAEMNTTQDSKALRAFAVSRWEQYSPSLSAEAFAAFKKVSASN